MWLKGELVKTWRKNQIEIVRSELNFAHTQQFTIIIIERKDDKDTHSHTAFFFHFCFLKASIYEIILIIAATTNDLTTQWLDSFFLFHFGNLLYYMLSVCLCVGYTVWTFNTYELFCSLFSISFLFFAAFCSFIVFLQ